MRMTCSIVCPRQLIEQTITYDLARRQTLWQDPDEADWSGRVLATPTCEPYGTATVSSNVLTFSAIRM